MFKSLTTNGTVTLEHNVHLVPVYTQTGKFISFDVSFSSDTVPPFQAREVGGVILAAAALSEGYTLACQGKSRAEVYAFMVECWRPLWPGLGTGQPAASTLT